MMLAYSLSNAQQRLLEEAARYELCQHDTLPCCCLHRCINTLQPVIHMMCGMFKGGLLCVQRRGG